MSAAIPDTTREENPKKTTAQQATVGFTNIHLAAKTIYDEIMNMDPEWESTDCAVKDIFQIHSDVKHINEKVLELTTEINEKNTGFITSICTKHDEFNTIARQEMEGKLRLIKQSNAIHEDSFYTYERLIESTTIARPPKSLDCVETQKIEPKPTDKVNLISLSEIIDKENKLM